MISLIKVIKRVTGIDEVNLHADELQNLLQAGGESRYTEIVRRGGAYTCRNTTAVASVIAIPTTAISFALYNPEADGGKSLIIDAVFAIGPANAGAALEQVSLIYNLGQQRPSAIPANSAMIPLSLNGKSTTSPVAWTTIGGTALDALTGVAINWMPIGNSVVTAVHTLPGGAVWVEVDGRLIVPPGRYFALHTLAASVGLTMNVGCMWHEKVLTLG